MLRSVDEQLGYGVLATDGEMGKVDDILFDDETWEIRYLVVETGSWLSSRRVLVAPYALGQPDWGLRKFPVALTMQQVEKSPDIDLDQPVSLQHQVKLHQYYSWPAYWMPEPGPAPVAPPRVPVPEPQTEHGDSHLRSCREVSGYHIQALDGEIGHVEDFVACMRTREKPVADLATVGHPSSLLCHLGNAAWRAGRTLRLDPQTWTLVGHRDGDQYLRRPSYRTPWVLPDVSES